ncbi:hypothetical protein WR25_27237 isoform H [Diploscapter pachys]|uniref:Uncharacterized protein n=1 Tax=Diploscapter pachys TaxID=2018661 RepID=A0A2A2LD43_9BILA|nr:hypothetical protein WR25_27237 isoform E [Diploscapter pachys]PAV84109.1 hypothetical protein WR25_27237 isoform H [Diploscapter pachys]
MNLHYSDAIEYKKVTDVAEKARREEELRIMKEKEKEEREKERIRSRQTTARKPPAWKYEKWRCETTQRNFRKSNSKDHGSTRAVESAPMGVRKKAPLRATSLNRNTASSTPNSTSPQETDKSGESSPDDKHMKAEHEKAIDDINADDYTAVFGARPKVARTPDHIQHSHSFF